MSVKKILAGLALVTIVAACQTTDKKVKDSPVLSEDQKQGALKDSANFTSIQWLDSTSINLGKVVKGAVVEVAFRFKNTGTKPLVFAKVEAGCGCTVPEKPEKPYAPGEEGVIKAKFDSQGQQVGPHTKYVTVESNTTPTIVRLDFNVEVTEKQ